MDVVGGFLFADGSHAKAPTGIDDHSRYCVSAALMARERTRPVCEALAAASDRHGVPQQILTDNGKVFTGRFVAWLGERVYGWVSARRHRFPGLWRHTCRVWARAQIRQPRRGTR